VTGIRKIAIPEAAIIPPMTVETKDAPSRTARRNRWQTKAANIKDERKRRHQDGAQSQARAFERGVDKRFAFFVFVLCEFDDQDRVFGGQTDEHASNQFAR